MKKKKMWPLKLSCCLLLCGLILGSGKMPGMEDEMVCGDPFPDRFGGGAGF